MGNSTLPTVSDKLNIMASIHNRKLIAAPVRGVKRKRFGDTRIKGIVIDPDKRWIRTWNDYLQRIKYFFKWPYNKGEPEVKGLEVRPTIRLQRRMEPMTAQSCIEYFINMVLRLTYNQFYTLCNMSLNAQVHIDCCQSPSLHL